MKISDWLSQAQTQLSEAGIDSARLDSLLLLEHELKLDRAYLLAHQDADLAPSHVQALAEQLSRRAKHEPLAYIRGYVEFYGRNFIVNKDVLVPRPESEDMITLLKDLQPAAQIVADIGTGSGALAITAALETSATVYAVDIDDACLQVAEQNALLHNHSIGIAKGNLLEPFLHDQNTPVPDVVLANLPYVPNEQAINQAATHEPALALFGGADGLDLYRTLFTQADTLKPTHILTEALEDQHSSLAAIAKAHGYTQTASSILIQQFSRD